MLPIPFINYIPSLFRIYKNSTTLAMTNKADNHISEWSNDVKNIKYILHPDRCPSGLLNELNTYLSAACLQYDDDLTKRKKIANAVRSHKFRGTWEDHTKIIIDIIAGGDSKIIKAGDTADFIETGDAGDLNNYYATEGVDNIDLDLGIDEIGDGTEVVFAGVFWIDTDNGSLTTEQVQMIVDNLKDDIVPAYYRIFIGYTVGSAFIKYPNGQIG